MVCACVHGIAFFDFFPQEKFQLMQPKHSTYLFFMIDHPHPANSNPTKAFLQTATLQNKKGQLHRNHPSITLL